MKQIFNQRISVDKAKWTHLGLDISSLATGSVLPVFDCMLCSCSVKMMLPDGVSYYENK